MGYRMPNIDRIADEGMRFTDSYGEQSSDDGDVLALRFDNWKVVFLQTFRELPPRQKAASFTIDQAVARLETALTTGH